MTGLLFASLVVTVITFSLFSYFKTTTKFVGTTSCENLQASLTAVDLGLWGTIKLGLNLVPTLWDNVPTYRRALDTLKLHSSKFVRLWFFTNWKSAASTGDLPDGIVLCSDLKIIKEVLRSNIWVNTFPDDHYLYKVSFGKPMGVLFGSGGYWATAHKVVLKGFRDHGVTKAARIEDLYFEEIHLLLNGLRMRLRDSTTDYAIFSPNRIFDEATLNVMFKLLFSRKFSKEDPLESRLNDLMQHNNSVFSVGLCAFDFLPFLKCFPILTATHRALSNFFNTVYDVVANERDQRAKRASDYQDLMDTFLKEVQAHEGSHPNYFTFESLQTTVRDLIFAGSDTIHVTLEHLILFMATNRHDQAKVQDEIDRVIGPDRFPTYEDRKSMIYTQAVLEETWRLASVLPSSFRMNSEDCQLGGMLLKKGTFLAPLFIGANHSEELWEDPMLFKPSRFISDAGQITNTEKSVVFSSGPRGCPGELMGRVASFLLTVTLLREFSWELSDKHPPLSPKNGRGLIRVPNEYFVKIRQRVSKV